MIRKAIEEYLLQNGFIKDNDIFIGNLQKQTGEIIVNGHRQVQVQNIEIKITFVGNGWIGESEENSTPTTQWNLSVNGIDQCDFIVESLEEFKQFLKL